MRTLVSAEAIVTPAGMAGNAILVEAGKVVAMGERREFATAGVDEVTYPGGYVVPGLRDAHLHPVPYAALLSGCSLKSARSMEDLVATLSSYAATLPDGAPVIATRLDDEGLAERRLPTRHDLDRAVPHRPAVIYRYCGHVAVANSEALRASRITASTPDPEGGSIDREHDGRPAGVLRETAAGLIEPALARGGRMEPDQLIDALERLAAIGVTSIGAMIGYGESPSEKLEAEVELWAAVAPRLPINVHGIVIADEPDRLSMAARELDHAGHRLRWLGVKRFADGSLGGHTAAMREPFADVDTTGTYRLTDGDAEVCRHALGLGGMVAIHAIGDRAVDGVLDLFANLIANGADPGSLRMEHVSVIAPDQVRRFADLGVTACVQPAFLASEHGWVADRVGPDRVGWLYPFRSLRAAGIPLAGSSDSPVEPPHPLWGIAASVDRHGVNRSEALPVLDALDLFTNGAARALREPEPLAPGAPADLTVLDTDLRSATADDIRRATVVDTYVDGASVDCDRTTPPWVE